ncbi:hypothetical protein DY000_02002396 [Brassica cretica]|uniref:F-box domain-containing protein n=1 Tax=Brassica cretica TaxID=69181 RepID=A0ABQ7CEX7_BRACR|nr:hypothetical protein DY000_02002396 [Brassica cretica]
MGLQILSVKEQTLCKNPNTNPMYIYADVLELILLRLPPKSLGRFKTVSKQWRSLLESNWFLEMHLSFGKTRRKILAARDCICSAPPSLRPNVISREGEEIVYLYCDTTRPSMSCDGLICIPEPGWINAGVGFDDHGVSSSQPRVDIFHYLGVFLRWARLRLFVLAALLMCSLFSSDDALSCAGRPIFLHWLDFFGVRDDFIKMMVSLLLWKLFFANT